MEALQVTGLYIYPIKSLGGIEVDEAMALKEGFENDRRWMLVDKEGNFLTQREHAQMAMISCAMADGKLQLSYKDERQSLTLEDYTDKAVRVKVWSSKLKAQEVDPVLSEWFSDCLGMEATLVKMTDLSKRPKRLFVPPFKTTLSFADGYPYLILGTASMDLLNSKLPEELPMDRFRANIIVRTTEAHEEDTWKESFDVGSSQLKVIKPCARCVVTTIDQQSGKKSKEPLKTLATYRQWRNKIWFGANAICMEEGVIKKGDVIRYG